MHRYAFVSLALFLMAAGCSGEPLQPNPPTTLPSEPNASPYPSIDPSLGESLYPNEQVLSGQIAAVIEESIRKQYQSGNALRDAHPKAHGCVTATLHIDDALPDSLAKGIFVPGKTYPAWIRFSNGSPDATRADIRGDARGMAIKVMGVPGKKLLAHKQNATTQDFIMINHPVFFANDPQRYLSLFEKTNSGSFFNKLTIPFSLGFKGSVIAFETTRSKISDPMNTRYWSMVPYQLGTGPDRQAIKFSAKPCMAVAEQIPDNPGHDYLRDALRARLRNDDACMELLVQPRTSDSMSVEDSMTEWEEAQAPFYKVATIVIPRQEFDTAEQNLFCENLSFSPWHTLPEHRPLGVTNRLRKGIYERISRVRHEMNSAERREPTARTSTTQIKRSKTNTPSGE
jgi:hypothetical protein